MAYSTSREVSDATPGATLLTALESLLTSHPSWTFVETDPTYSRKIWKNDSNRSGQTFHCALTSSGNNLTAYIFENYNVTTHLPQYVGPPGATSYTATADTATYSNSEAWTGATTKDVGGNTSDYTYWIFVTKDSIYVQAGQSYADDYPLYIGAWEPYWSGVTNNNYFGMCSLGYNTDSAGTTTRCPGYEGAFTSDTFNFEMHTQIQYAPHGLGYAVSDTYGSEAIAAPLAANTKRGGNRGTTGLECVAFLADTDKYPIGTQVVVNGQAYVTIGSYAKVATGNSTVYAVNRVMY